MGNKISAFIENKVVRYKSSRFPLLKLPSDAINNVLLTMDPVDLITFSLCTNSTSRYAASLKFKKLQSTLKIGRNIIVEIRWPDDTIVKIFLLDANSKKWAEGDNKITKFSGPNTAIANFGPANAENGGFQSVGRREWKKENYEMRCWLEHFRQLFGGKFQRIHFLQNSKRYDTSLLEATIGNVSFSMVEISPQCANAHVQDLHKNLQSLKRSLLARNPYEALADFQRFLSRNFDMFGFDEMLNPTLDDLLVSNSKCLCVKSTLSGQVTNRFLKLWAKGGNRRMVWLLMYFPFGQHPEMTEVLKGIEHKSIGRRQNVWTLKRRNGSSGALYTKIANGWMTLMLVDVEDLFEKYLF